MLKSAMISYLNILLANSMITQLQKLWILYYAPTHLAQFFSDRYTTTDPVSSF